MPGADLLLHLAREALSPRAGRRVPEPALVMSDPAQVDGFERAGREDGPMAPTYLLHTLQLCRRIRPGDQVVDLACGPANQLCQVARLNPRARFLGIDLSEAMLVAAWENVRRQGLANVRLLRGDISALPAVAGRSADLVMSTLSLHHLPDEARLQACFGEIARIVKDPGAVYLADFGRLKREATLEFLASRDAGRHPPRYVADFRDSLRAAFPLPALRRAARQLAFLDGLSVRHTFLVPFLVVVATPPRHPLPAAAVAACRDLWLRLPERQRRDFEDLRAFLAAGGLPTPHPAG